MKPQSLGLNEHFSDRYHLGFLFVEMLGLTTGSPAKEFPLPEKREEITPNPKLPEEEEYLPDEEEIDEETRKRKEIEEPNDPRRKQQFPPKTEPESPQEKPNLL